MEKKEQREEVPAFGDTLTIGGCLSQGALRALMEVEECPEVVMTSTIVPASAAGTMITRAERPAANRPRQPRRQEPSRQTPRAHHQTSALPVLVEVEGAQYVIDGDVIGEGGMGSIQLGTQVALEREVAIKRLKPDVIEAGVMDVVAMLLRESRITGRLEHPNIVPVYALGADAEGLPLLVMKRVVGHTWRAFMKEEDHPIWDRADGDRFGWQLKILMSVCDAVHYAHDKGVVHRDLKPANVMLGEFGEIYVMDWGIAVEVGGAPPPRSADGEQLIVGTLGYMAPEMLEDGGTIDARTDVYQLGAMLHELITGAPPHKRRNVLMAMTSITASQPMTYDDDVPEGLVEICHRAMARDPDARYPSADAFRRAIAAHLQHRTAAELTREAEERLGALRWMADAEEEVPNVAVHQLFAECRFGFEEALRQWPTSERARAGRREVLTLMIRRELERDNVDAADALLGELGDGAEALVEELARRREAQERSAAQIASLKALERDVDPNVGAAERSRLLLSVTLILGGVLPISLFVLRGLGVGWLLEDPRALMLGMATMILGVMPVLYWSRRTFPNRASQRIAVAVVLGMVGCFVHRIIATVREMQFEDTILGDYLIMGLTLALVSMMLDKRVYYAVAVYALGLAAALISGVYVLEWLAAANFLAFLLLAIVWRRTNALTADR